jgi:hypothetical protein
MDDIDVPERFNGGIREILIRRCHIASERAFRERALRLTPNIAQNAVFARRQKCD